MGSWPRHNAKSPGLVPGHAHAGLAALLLCSACRIRGYTHHPTRKLMEPERLRNGRKLVTLCVCMYNRLMARLK